MQTTSAVVKIPFGDHNSKRYKSLDNAITNMIRFTDVKEPIKQNARIYKKLSKAYIQSLIDIDRNKRVTGNL